MEMSVAGKWRTKMKILVAVPEFAIQKQQRRQRLVLGRSRHGPLDRQRSQKRLDFRFVHFGRVPLIVENDVPFRPQHTRLRGPQAVMLQADAITKSLQQFWGTGGKIRRGDVDGHDRSYRTR